MTNNSCNTNITVTSNQILLPSQCSFSAYLTSTQASVTGDGTAYSIISDTELFDIGSNYNHATGIFVAPVTAHYSFSAQCAYLADASNTGATEVNFYLKYGASGSIHGTSLPGRKRINTFYGPSGLIMYQVHGTVSLSATDQVYIVIKGFNGAKVDSVYGHATDVYTCFSGNLIG